MAKLIGTAGHVDHGKTTLIKALTGIDADRLREEKERGMTIDVGFAHIDLPNIGRVSIVDVPGHERFLSNMLVGALSTDLALLCVAADEGVKPQTREHLQILELLPVQQMVVALTRADLADEETRQFARADVVDLLAKSRFNGAEIVLVSASSGEGLESLRLALSTALTGENSAPGRDWYLPIDRAFSAKGHGTVVTGTLAAGSVRVGDRAMLMPGSREVRIRGIEIHGQPVEVSQFGTRTALNLAGVKVEDLHRGMALGSLGRLYDTQLVDAEIRWVGPVKHGQRVRVSVGADEVIGKVFLNDQNAGLTQLRFERPTPVAADQPLIVRRYSPPEVLGGGTILVPVAKPRRKRETPEVAKSENIEDGILAAISTAVAGMPTEEVCRRLGRSSQALGEAFESLRNRRLILGFAGLWFTPSNFAQSEAEYLDALRRAHEQYPTRTTLARDLPIKSTGLAWTGKPLDRIVATIATSGKIEVYGANVRLIGFHVTLPARQRELLDRVKAALEQEAINVPGVFDLSRSLGVPPQAVEEILKVGQQAGELIRVADGLVYTTRQIDELKRAIASKMEQRRFPASEVREALSSSRKYVIPLLEYLDSVRFTTRIGENRVVNS